MINLSKFTLLFFTFSLLFLLPQKGHALISISPKNPKANSQVTLTLSSYSYNVSTANVVWKVDGKTVLSGEGEKTLTLTTGEVGQSLNVTVSALNEDGSGSDESITVSPSSVTMLYEAPFSYVPLLYEGRSLPSTGGVVRVTALPQVSDGGALVNSPNLSYTWYIDDQVLKNSSGRGKQAAIIRLDFLKNSQVIKVIARTPGGNEAQGSITVYPHTVMPLLYSFDPIFGSVLTKAYGKRIETTAEFTASLEPYYVSINDGSKPTYDWYLDGALSTPLDGRTLGFQPKNNDYGSKSLDILVKGGYRNIQKGELKSEIIFDTRK